MQHFAKSFVAPLLSKRRWTRVCEIGASLGGSTELLAAIPSIALTVIDPCLDCDLNEKFASNPHVTVKKGISLEVLPDLRDAFDCILIDGDHNWYTVYYELKVISECNLLKQGGIVFFHDVEWPYGRRDMYYQPEMIPPEHRHDCAKKGILRGQSELSDRSEVNSVVWNATHEGGAHNGVLTAIEDFLHEHKGEYGFFQVREEFGLGIMYPRRSFIDDLRFLTVQCKVVACNVFTSAKRFTQAYFPSAFSLAKSLLSRT
jgi:predicted O-methyltransferase YrrM